MEDECKTAAEMYACGKEKEPAIVDAIFDSAKGNGTVVIFELNYKIKRGRNWCSFFSVCSTRAVRPRSSPLRFGGKTRLRRECLIN